MGKMSNSSGLVGLDRGAGRNGINTKVAVPSSNPTLGKQPSQKITGKLQGMYAMPGGADSKRGGPIKTAPSNPIDGKTKASGSAMGSGGVIDGFA